MSKSRNQELRKILDMPFWFMQASWVIGLILMPSLTSIILYAVAAVTGLVYIVTLGKFAKEIGKNPTRWSMTTLITALLLGPVVIWISYIYAFIEVRDKIPQSTGDTSP
jgi:hypothetical protein